MFIDKDLTYSLGPSSGSFSTFTAAERQWKRLLKLCTQCKYKDYCKHQNEMSTKSHDAKKAREHNLFLSEEKSQRQENVSNRIAKCRARKKARVNNNASWQKATTKTKRLFWIHHSNQFWKGGKLSCENCTAQFKLRHHLIKNNLIYDKAIWTQRCDSCGPHWSSHVVLCYQ